MKMNFRRQRNNTGRITAAAAAFFLVALWIFPSFFAALSRGAMTLTAPFLREKTEAAIGLADYPNITRSRAELTAENKKLLFELAVLTAHDKERAALKKENAELKELFGRRREEHGGVLAAVLSKPPIAPYDMVFIDAGEEDGIAVGDFVSGYGETIIGRVAVVSRGTARVKLFSSPGEKFEVIAGKANVSAEAEGLGGGNFRIRLPRGVDISEGDPVIIPSATTQVAGVVSVVRFAPNDPFQDVLFKSTVNMFELRWVEVIPKDSGL